MINAYNYVTAQFNHAVSHITPRIISSVNGEFGGEYPIFCSLLMSIYWFFDADYVAMNNVLIDDEFNKTSTWTDVAMVHRQKLAKLSLRKNELFPY